MRHAISLALLLGLASWLVPNLQANPLTGLAAALSLAQDKAKDDVKKDDVKKDEVKGVKDEGKKDKLPPPKMEPKAAPIAQCYYECTVICYKPVVKQFDVKEVVTRLVPREEKYTYTVFVPVAHMEKRLETYYVTVQKPVEYTTTILVPVTTPEKRKIMECNIVKTEVDVNYTVMVPKVVKQARTVSYQVIQRSLVEQTVPVCKVVMVPVTDCCGNCYNVCQTIVVPQKVTREVCTPIMKTKEIVCDVVVCEAQPRVGKSIVCKPVFNEKEIVVNVTRCVPVQKKMAGTVCELIPKTREVECRVVVCEPMVKTGVRTVYDCKSDVVIRRVTCTEMVPYPVTQRIPIIINDCCRPCW